MGLVALVMILQVPHQAITFMTFRLHAMRVKTVKTIVLTMPLPEPLGRNKHAQQQAVQRIYQSAPERYLAQVEHAPVQFQITLQHN